MQRGLRWMGMNVREKIELKVHLAFDAEASVWYIAESDIPGLSLEADDPHELVRRISECAGELIELNEDEILQNAREQRPTVSFRPVFDSPVPVAAYA